MKNITKQKRKRKLTPNVNSKGTAISGHHNYNTTGKILSIIKRKMSINQQLEEIKLK